MQLGQQHLVQPLPDTCLVSIPKPSPAGHARAEAELLGQVFPLDTGVQNEEDPAQHLPVRYRPAARVPEPSLLLR